MVDDLIRKWSKDVYLFYLSLEKILNINNIIKKINKNKKLI